MAIVLKGAPVAEALTDKLAQRARLLTAGGVTPTLAIIRVGERPDDLAYERGAMKRCEKIGVRVVRFLLGKAYTQDELLHTIRRINEDAGIHGCLMFRPLASSADELAACALLASKKDVDCITDSAMAGVFTGCGTSFPPCTAQACLEILDYYGYALTGRRVTVIGRSLVIGRPVSMMLQARNATVTMCHTRTADMPSQCRAAEIIIAAAGKAGMVDGTYVSPHQVVIDVGINMDAEGNLCGDVLFNEVEPIVSALTPVPGGVGTVTSTVLAKHVIEAAERALT